MRQAWNLHIAIFKVQSMQFKAAALLCPCREATPTFLAVFLSKADMMSLNCSTVSQASTWQFPAPRCGRCQGMPKILFSYCSDLHFKFF